MVNLGSRLKTLREQKKLTQVQLADRIGVAPNSISAYEAGIRCPSFENLVKLARIFHVSTDFLLGLEKRHVLDISALGDEEAGFVLELVKLLSKKPT